MEIVLYIVVLVASFFFLIKGADFLVDNASYIAKAMRIPAVIIGLTIVAFGTSAPEAGVSIVSSMSGDNALAISNVVGSNLFNMLVVVGCCALIRNVSIDKDIKHRDMPICLGVTLLLFIFVMNLILSRIEGVFLFILIIGYVVMLVSVALKEIKEAEQHPDDEVEKLVVYPKFRIFLSFIGVILGVFVIYLASEGVVLSAKFFAKLLGVSDTVIGLTIVAFGTSLPELVTSVVASRKGENAIALGNIVGSNLFNLLFVLGIASTISPISIATENLIDVGVCLLATIIFFILIFKNNELKRRHGIFMLMLYASYMAYILIR